VEDVMEDQVKDYEIGHQAEILIQEINAHLKHDEREKSYIEKQDVLKLVFRVTDFMRQLSKRI